MGSQLQQFVPGGAVDTEEEGSMFLVTELLPQGVLW